MRDEVELKNHIYNTFRAWKQPGGTGEDWWSDLLFAQELAGSMRKAGLVTTGRKMEQELCEVALKDLEKRRSNWAEAMTRRFKQGQTIGDVAAHFNVTEPTIYNWQQWACRDMAAYILAQENALLENRTTRLIHSLPAKRYHKLFGVDLLTGQIIEQLTQSNPSWTLTLLGFGGIGKTALADVATRKMIKDQAFRFVVWIRYAPATLDGRSRTPGDLFEEVMLKIAAQPQIGGQNQPRPLRNRMVQAALKSAPYLVIIDNVEEPADLEYLLGELPRFTDPSRFLITSRARPAGANHVPMMFIPPLSRPDGKALWRYEAGLLSLNGVADVEDAYLDALYDRIGGNPLMIKVTVGLATQFDLPDIIADLEHQPTGLTDENFRRVYERAWTALSDNARLVLQSMAMISEEGTDLAHLAGISRLEESATRAAIQELTGRSLLEVQSNGDSKKYGVHRLTRTFINTDVIGWRDNAN